MKPRHVLQIGLLLAAVMASGVTEAQAISDPLEPVNRAIFSFNEKVDEYFFKPVAKGYTAIVPSLVRKGVSNVFSNVEDLFGALNSALQGKGEAAGHDFGRVLTNTTFGLGGMLDIASDIGIPKSGADFGQTFGKWGVGPGPFLMLPLLGPSNVRDATGLAVHAYLDPVGNLSKVPTRNSLEGLRVVDTRAQLLDASDLLGEAALDKYTFLRRAYSQARESKIYDGHPPRRNDDEDDDADPAPAPGTSSANPPKSALEPVPAAEVLPVTEEAPAPK